MGNWWSTDTKVVSKSLNAFIVVALWKNTILKYINLTQNCIFYLFFDITSLCKLLHTITTSKDHIINFGCNLIKGLYCLILNFD